MGTKDTGVGSLN